VNERRIMKLRVGSGLPNIQKKDIVKLLIQFPDLVEQRRIANLLNTAKHEIDLLTKLANQYSLQKNGLMQKLLSGEWNIRKKEAA
ncbi:MAG: restriction endonuclease subunit S, partial [Rhodobacteraceae bacterium]|nr:restriction endonuclease subunit S [Paracoccaceae bacterium]